MEEEILREFPFRCRLSFKPLLTYLKKREADSGGEMLCDEFEIDLLMKQAPDLFEPISDLSILKTYEPQFRRIMRLLFPLVSWENEAVAALIPFIMKPISVSPAFDRLFISEEGRLMGKINIGKERFALGRVIRAYLFILKKFYGIDQPFDYPIIRIVEDPKTGLDRYYKMNADFRFVDVRTDGDPRPLSNLEIDQVRAHLTDPKFLKTILPPHHFELCGFVIIHAVDVTESEVVSALERDLIDKTSIVSEEGFLTVQHRLRTLFRRPNLIADLSAIHENQILSINSGSRMTRNCIFADSMHVPVSEVKGTLYEKAIASQEIILVPDVAGGPMPLQKKEALLREGIHSVMIAPLPYKGKIIGILVLGSHHAMDLNPIDELVMDQIRPLFSMSVVKALDAFENQIQTIIKEQCTAIHPSVEWRFRKAAISHIENRLKGNAGEMPPIVFKDVYPLYGNSDIRGSATERNRSIQLDLTEHLHLAWDVIRKAHQSRPLLILQELGNQIESRLSRIETGLKTGDEVSILKFLREEVEVLFHDVEGFDSETAFSVAKYRSSMDPKAGTVYRMRKQFEESVSMLAERLATFLDQEDQTLQSIFPHYFERHRTDGIDYLIYAGESLNETARFNSMYLRNIRLWQIRLAAMLARVSEQMKPRLPVPLETAHLILVQDSPMAIRFRFDEKRFDADGTYDIRHEIIKSRIDKATLKGGIERLTQPGKIAVVYSNPLEAREILRHIEYVKSEKLLTGEIERVELEDLPGVQGLKAIRISVDFDARIPVPETGLKAG
ncbi:MAG: GAF domain-containing protein [Thermodesulfobacteriota bacterium]